jgi:hypothetical protein
MAWCHHNPAVPVPVQVPGTETLENMEVDPVPDTTGTMETDTGSIAIHPVGQVLDAGQTTVEADTDMPDLIPQTGEDNSDDEAEEEELQERQQPRSSVRIAQGILKPSKYAMASVGTLVLTKDQWDTAMQGGGR